MTVTALPLPISPHDPAIDALIAAARRMGERGWLPATSGNLSCRLADGSIAMTASGVDKQNLEPRHLMRLDAAAPPPPGASAEAGLHLVSYRHDPAIGAVLHAHALSATVLSRRAEAAGEVVLEGYELLKAFSGVTTHATRLGVPVFANDQDIDRLSRLVEARMPRFKRTPGYLIAGHGVYAWGRDVDAAFRHLEAFDFLFNCVLAEEGIGR